MNHISMPLCIVLIALMYFILREPCPCDEEDKNRVVEGLDWWWWVIIGWLGIGFLILCYGVMANWGNLKKRLGYNYFYMFLSVFMGVFGGFAWKNISKDIGDVANAARYEEQATAKATAKAQAEAKAKAERGAYLDTPGTDESIEPTWVEDPSLPGGGRLVAFGKVAEISPIQKVEGF